MTALPDRLTTTFALDQLTESAASLSPQAFHSLLAPVFGDDLPEACYQCLHDALREGTLANPVHQIGTQAHGRASYDNATRIIHLHPDVIEAARQQPGGACELATILLHEFGHHLDCLLRQEYAPRLTTGRTQVAQDAWLEEGARFAYLFCEIEPRKPGKLTVAHLHSGDADIHLQVDRQALRHYIRLSQGQEAQHSESRYASHEGFSAGQGNEARESESWGHGSIEEDLKYAGFDEKQRKAIYFGNWLRDYSQLLDPKLVRAADAPKDFPAKLSREVLTQLVDLLALRAFPSLQSTPQERSHYVVTPQMLGVYRPSEHIDNPFNPRPPSVDPRTIDEAFEAPIAEDDALLQVDPDTSMKRYIFTSVDYMSNCLRDAMAAGPTPKDMRQFGAALHVLEDYFAHSNYAELSLRKQKHDRVLPWTAKVDCRHEWPVVTGMFAGSDVIASLAEPMANLLFKPSGSFENITPGQRANSELALLILLQDHPDPKWQQYLQTSLEVRDTLADLPGFNGMRLVSWIISSPIRGAQDLLKLGYQTLLNLIGNSVDDLQTLRLGNPELIGSTNPTHSQLAKDHDVHPLHTLAALMARVAVREVGKAMYHHWEGKRLLDPVKIARSYFTHPFDSEWQDELVSHWASEHREKIEQAGNDSIFATLHGHANHEVDTSVWDRVRGLFG